MNYMLFLFVWFFIPLSYCCIIFSLAICCLSDWLMTPIFLLAVSLYLLTHNFFTVLPLLLKWEHILFALEDERPFFFKMHNVLLIYVVSQKLLNCIIVLIWFNLIHTFNFTWKTLLCTFKNGRILCYFITFYVDVRKQ